MADAETTLGYRLGQHHLGVIIWSEDTAAVDNELTELEQAVATLAEYFGAAGRALFEPSDERICWAWIPLGGTAEIDLAGLPSIVEGWERPFIAALGAPPMKVSTGSSEPTGRPFKPKWWRGLHSCRGHGSSRSLRSVRWP